MARIRSIKPEFWKSDQVNRCSVPARLLFIGLWSVCDDEGRGKASATLIKREIFPDDPIDADAVKAMLHELARVGLIELYFADGQESLHVTGFARHQKIDKRWASKLPAPPGRAPAAGPCAAPPPVAEPVTGPSPVLADSRRPPPTLAPGKVVVEVDSERNRSGEVLVVDPAPAPARAGDDSGQGEGEGRPPPSLEAQCRALLPALAKSSFAPMLRLRCETGGEVVDEDFVAGIRAALAKNFLPQSWGVLDTLVRRAAKDRIAAALAPKLVLVVGGDGKARAGPREAPLSPAFAALVKVHDDIMARQEGLTNAAN